MSWPHTELYRRLQWDRPHASSTTQNSISWLQRKRAPPNAQWDRPHASRTPSTAFRHPPPSTACRGLIRSSTEGPSGTDRT
eukprot:7910625-Pyramimonas_sp.AAC.1